MAEPHNTPVSGPTPRPSSPVDAPAQSGAPDRQPLAAPGEPRVVLHLGDPIRFNPDTHAALTSRFRVVRPSTPERQRPQFKQALAEGKWGDFEGIFRPFWTSGGEMGAWDADLINLLPPRVKVFASAGAGFDWVDTKHLGDRGIVYCNGGDAPADGVADFAECHEKAPGQSSNLRGQALGIVGMGKIGQRIAMRCHHGFGMKVHYFDVERKDARIEQESASTFHDSLQGLLGAVDCAVLCSPASTGAGALINASTLAQFRPGARFVNIARGALVDEDDLVAALDDGRISSVALDVHANEPHPHEGLKQLAARGRAMLTCHNAGGTVQAHAGFEELSMRNVMNVLSGGQPLSAVNLGHLKTGRKQSGAAKGLGEVKR
ncbi:d-isomer specific 2-hydroxyacid dehydrogenase, NAD binding domain-containing protein [Hirsutella rhossiliensis]|uniref:D-isomer specific 2-hydroxyacid dehydrogenase, NAD binding domain-containing protein n=1 Tax=Hirsutella rhossiliensis TaxID=111463 RepID=A0A9P8MN91_9HYPO|nr:d-isomer specific 2-hydroxyacid dehydrogenase, NAD binding domain-containing protein [Hirsutella rhossiliensis]KAH0957101.1 d-isomer specific 2-hydroxyacid dehydrogenase, NAD binding domain-containing protein [Hirsutella rhossiliensis]